MEGIVVKTPASLRSFFVHYRVPQLHEERGIERAPRGGLTLYVALAPEKHESSLRDGPWVTIITSAVCSDRDVFCKARGRDISEGRFVAHLEWELIHTPKEVARGVLEQHPPFASYLGITHGNNLHEIVDEAAYLEWRAHRFGATMPLIRNSEFGEIRRLVTKNPDHAAHINNSCWEGILIQRGLKAMPEVPRR